MASARSCFAGRCRRRPTAGRRRGQDQEPAAQVYDDLYYGSITAYDTQSHKVVAKAVTDIENRSGALVTAGGVWCSPRCRTAGWSPTMTRS
jgi:hypothetical protein